uniref:RIKEN cDNA 3110082I17 gene n=1 Tax=Nannospalax galili TaxID=1026970 RepID=A0A8C6QVQ6_NANGA
LGGEGRRNKSQWPCPVLFTPTTASKVQEASPKLTPEERRILERKLKKERKKEEKKLLREAGITAPQTAKRQNPPAKPPAAVLALDYLQGWAQKQENWRFQKTRQTWLLLNMYDKDKVCAWWAVPNQGDSIHTQQAGIQPGSLYGGWNPRETD